MPKESENIFKNIQSSISGVLGVKSPLKTFQRIWAWQRWTGLGLFLKSWKDYEASKSSRKSSCQKNLKTFLKISNRRSVEFWALPWSKLRKHDEDECALNIFQKNPKNILKNCPALEFQQSTWAKLREHQINKLLAKISRRKSIVQWRIEPEKLLKTHQNHWKSQRQEVFHQ